MVVNREGDDPVSIVLFDPHKPSCELKFSRTIKEDKNKHFRGLTTDLQLCSACFWTQHYYDYCFSYSKVLLLLAIKCFDPQNIHRSIIFNVIFLMSAYLYISYLHREGDCR